MICQIKADSLTINKCMTVDAGLVRSGNMPTKKRLRELSGK